MASLSIGALLKLCGTGGREAKAAPFSARCLDDGFLHLAEWIRFPPRALHRLVEHRPVLVQHCPEIDRALDELARRLAQRIACLHLPYVVLHVLGVPTARVRDEREGRENT